MDHEDPAQKKTATDEGLQSQADEQVDKKTAQADEDVPDPRDPQEWRDMPKEGGGA